MIKERILLEEIVNDRKYTLYCEKASPLGELHDVLMKWKGYTVDRMQQAQEEEMSIKQKMCEESPEDISPK